MTNESNEMTKQELQERIYEIVAANPKGITSKETRKEITEYTKEFISRFGELPMRKQYS